MAAAPEREAVPAGRAASLGTRSGAPLRRVRLGLDWSPNTTHVGLFVALQCGAFTRRGLDVELVAPASLRAANPGAGLLSGELHAGLCPCDQLVSPDFRNSLLAVAVLIAQDISAVVVREGSIGRPRELAGRRYASCGYPLEAATLNALIRADGGSGCVVEVCPPMRTSTEAMLLDGLCDAAWQYLTWEVLRAQRAGVRVRAFRLADFGVAFGYMNSIAVTRALVDAEPGLVRLIVEAVAEGSSVAATDPDAAARLLYEGSGRHADLADLGLTAESVRQLAALGALRGGGAADPAVWAAFAGLLRGAGLAGPEAQAACAPGDRAVWTNRFVVGA